MDLNRWADPSLTDDYRGVIAEMRAEGNLTRIQQFREPKGNDIP